MKWEKASKSYTEMVQMVLPSDTNTFGNVLGGKVMHWIDLAGVIAAQRYCRKQVVTASMDTLDFLCPIKMGQIAVLQAKVTYVANTSMEVKVDVFSEDPLSGERKETSTAYLTYVAIDENLRPTKVPKLKLETKEEKEEFEH